MWFDNLTVREYMRHAWHNLMGFVEQFTIGFLAMRFKPGFGFIHTPRPEGSVISPISVLPEETIDPAMKVMTLLQRNRKESKAAPPMINEYSFQGTSHVLQCHKSLESFKIYLHAPTQDFISLDCITLPTAFNNQLRYLERLMDDG